MNKTPAYAGDSRQAPVNRDNLSAWRRCQWTVTLSLGPPALPFSRAGRPDSAMYIPESRQPDVMLRLTSRWTQDMARTDSGDQRKGPGSLWRPETRPTLTQTRKAWAGSGACDPSQRPPGCLTRLRATRDKARADPGDLLARQGPPADLIGRLE